MSRSDLESVAAALCQEHLTVPIVEPAVLMDGDHSIRRCEHVTNALLEEFLNQRVLHRVYLEVMVLKPNMIVKGKKNPNRAGHEGVAA